MRAVDETNTEARRGAIIAAAIRCLERKGVAKTAINDICKEAGMRSGHIYYYFENKDAILLAIMAHQQQIALELIEHMLKGSGDIVGQIYDVHLRAEERRMAIGLTPIVRIELECYVSRLEGYNFLEENETRILLDAIRKNAIIGIFEGRLPKDLDIDVFTNAVALIWEGLAHSRLSPRFDVEENRRAVRLLMAPWTSRAGLKPVLNESKES